MVQICMSIISRSQRRITLFVSRCYTVSKRDLKLRLVQNVYFEYSIPLHQLIHIYNNLVVYVDKCTKCHE